MQKRFLMSNKSYSTILGSEFEAALNLLLSIENVANFFVIGGREKVQLLILNAELLCQNI